MKTSIVTVEMLRTPGERRALVVACASFAAVLLFVAAATLGSVLMLLGLGFAVGTITVAYEQSRRRRQSVMVTAKQLPRIHALIEEAAERLTYGMPSVYIEQSPVLNAYALSLFGNEAMVLNSGLIDAMEERELAFVIGHELTHMKCSHTFWRILGGKHPVLRMPLLSLVGSLFLRWWDRKAELTGDRGGLIACGDLPAALRALVTLAVGSRLAKEVDVDEMIRQSVSADSNMLGALSTLGNSHPDVASRVRALLEFFQSGAPWNKSGLQFQERSDESQADTVGGGSTLSAS